MAGVPVGRREVGQQPRAEERETTADEVVDDDPAPRHTGHLAQQGRRLVGLQVMDDERRVDDVERPVGVGERPAVADVQLEPGRARHPSVGGGRGVEDLGPAVDAGQAPVAPGPAGRARAARAARRRRPSRRRGCGPAPRPPWRPGPPRWPGRTSPRRRASGWRAGGHGDSRRASRGRRAGRRAAPPPRRGVPRRQATARADGRPDVARESRRPRRRVQCRRCRASVAACSCCRSSSWALFAVRRAGLGGQRARHVAGPEPARPRCERVRRPGAPARARASIEITGTYDAATKAAVTAFQAAHTLTANGIVAAVHVGGARRPGQAGRHGRGRAARVQRLLVAKRHDQPVDHGRVRVRSPATASPPSRRTTG